MKPALLVTIDTESDNLWARVRTVSLANIQALPALHERLTSIGAAPTYLVSYPVSTDHEGRRAINAVLGRGTCEIGAHLHPWTTPPYGEEATNGHLTHPMPSELSDELFQCKMSTLTEAIERACGSKPVSYRAGRWGLAASHVGILERLGYVVDSSVTPGMAWADRRDGRDQVLVDYRSAPAQPYLLNYENVSRPGDSHLIEVPVSIVTCGWGDVLWDSPGFFSGNRLWERIGQVLFFRQLWLRPAVSTQSEMLRVLAILLRKGAAAINIMFHSSEVMPGGSPYNQTPEDVQRFYRRLETAISFALQRDAQPMTLKEYAFSLSLATAEHARA